jgi:hypothetical protein
MLRTVQHLIRADRVEQPVEQHGCATPRGHSRRPRRRLHALYALPPPGPVIICTGWHSTGMVHQPGRITGGLLEPTMRRTCMHTSHVWACVAWSAGGASITTPPASCTIAAMPAASGNGSPTSANRQPDSSGGRRSTYVAPPTLLPHRYTGKEWSLMISLSGPIRTHGALVRAYTRVVI